MQRPLTVYLTHMINSAEIQRLQAGEPPRAVQHRLQHRASLHAHSCLDFSAAAHPGRLWVCLLQSRMDKLLD